MLGLADRTVATLAFIAVSSSFPCFLYGAWIMIDAEQVTWGVLTHHLKFIVTGLALTTVPLVGWMIPRLFEQISGGAAIHAFLGLQAYAMLAFGFTGIVRVFRAKYQHDLYHEYDEDVLLDEIGTDRLQYFRRRIRIGVFGYVLFWILAYLVGIARYLTKYW